MARLLEASRDIDVAERVFDLRLEHGWSQSELARRADVNRNTVLHLEQGKHFPHIGTMRKLARALGVPVRDLLAEPNERGKFGVET